MKKIIRRVEGRTIRGMVLSACTIASLAACAAEVPPPVPDEAGLPDAAITAFQDYLDRISENSLVCATDDISAARALSAYVDGDAVPDFVIETRALHCQTRRGEPAVGYFCGATACSLPLLLSGGEDGWQVVQLMSGNHVRAMEHYRETRIEVREIDRGAPGGRNVLVREYAWREGELVRINEYSEAAMTGSGTR